MIQQLKWMKLLDKNINKFIKKRGKKIVIFKLDNFNMILKMINSNMKLITLFPLVYLILKFLVRIKMVN